MIPAQFWHKDTNSRITSSVANTAEHIYGTTISKLATSQMRYDQWQHID